RRLRARVDALLFRDGRTPTGGHAVTKTKADTYNHNEIISGRLTMAEVTELVKFYQSAKGLTADGMAGPKTQRELEIAVAIARGLAPAVSPATFKLSPMPVLGDGRRAVLTSGFGPRGKTNKQHNGVDL